MVKCQQKLTFQANRRHLRRYYRRREKCFICSNQTKFRRECVASSCNCNWKKNEKMKICAFPSQNISRTAALAAAEKCKLTVGASQGPPCVAVSSPMAIRSRTAAPLTPINSPCASFFLCAHIIQITLPLLRFRVDIYISLERAFKALSFPNFNR